jgi:hypothetical protein
MNEVTRGLRDVVAHLAQQGVLTASDTQVIFQVLDDSRSEASAQAPQTPQTPQTLSGPYYEARHKALHDRKVHP